uniref:Regulator of microtubule dynamics protein 1 n=1 Tax=Lutzomyia longipalpis TaxID=7200 RepID=A0A1B0CL79_LUTLO
MDLPNCIASLQKLLYKGFENTIESDLNWLNEVSGEFVRLFADLHKFMVFDCSGEKNSIVMEEIFLCIRQITVCIRNLEKVLTVEKEEGIVLTEDANFVVFLDAALDLLAPMTTFQENPENVAESNADAYVRSKEIRSIVDSLISQTLAFVNVALEKDKAALTAHCQRVLKECISLEEECAAECATDLNRRFKAELLEVALTHLEQTVNSSLLRLVCHVFVELSENPVATFREAVRRAKETDNESFLEGETEKFDLLLDRILQIGVLGIAFSGDQVAKSILKSCLASSECLDTALIPSIFTPSGSHSRILEEHWRSEMQTFQREIQKIIDTDAFCMATVDALSTLLEDSAQAGNPESLQVLLKHIEILQAHLQINEENLHLTGNAVQEKNLSDFRKMVVECEAALKLREAEKIEMGRITKRFRILLAVLKRFHGGLGNGCFVFDEGKTVESARDEAEEKVESPDFFQTLGINPHVSVILYKTRTAPTDSLVAQFSKLSLARTGGGASTKAPRRNLSLRRAMFRRIVEKNGNLEEAESTLNLNIEVSAYKYSADARREIRLKAHISRLSRLFVGQPKSFPPMVLRAAVLRRLIQQWCSLSGLGVAAQRNNSRNLQTLSYIKNFRRRTWTPVPPVLIAFSIFGYSFGSSAKEEEDKKKNALKMSDSSVEELIPQSDQFFDENKYREAYEVLLNHPERDTNVEVIWRIARGYYKTAKETENKTEKAALVRSGFEFIQRGLGIDDTHYAIHKWYAILLDAKSEQDGMWERVNQLHRVKHHMVRATECNPNDPTSWWILGCFEFGIADMSWYVMKIVQKALKEPPTGTYENALECFLRAENIKPMFYTTNHLWLGKCYKALKDPEKAKHHLNIAATTPVNSVEELIPQSDQFFDENKYREAYEVLLNHPERDTNVEVIWRIARGYYKTAKETENKTEKAALVRSGFEFIQRGLGIDDTHYAIHKWYAILLDAKSEQDGMWERVNQLHRVKHHMVRATECNPNDPTSWWILGCFEFGIADMSWYVMKIVQKALKEPPTGTYENALECFLRAENIKPMFYTTNHLWLGKCYKALKDPEKAKHHLNIAATTPVKNYDDKKCQEEALQLLKKL